MRQKTFFTGILAAVVIISAVLFFRYRSKLSNEAHTRQIFAMDTVMSLTAYGPQGEEALEEAYNEINYLDALLSTENVDSEVSRINSNGFGTVSEDTELIVTEALKIYKETGGLFDITIYPLMKLWGFTSGEYHVPTDEEIITALEKVDASQIELKGNQLKLDEGQQIDLGGIAKGYTSGKVMDIFREHGIDSAIVSLGGNVQTLGTKADGSSFKVGVRDPKSSYDEALAVISVRDLAVITSGGYERYFEENGRTYIHIMDTRTGRPAESDLESVTIVAADGMLADALSTSLYVMGLQDAKDYWRAHQDQFDMLLIDDEGQIYISEGLNGAVDSDNEMTLLSGE